MLLPVREPVCQVVTRLDRCLVYDHHRLFRERGTKGVKTGAPHAGVEGACKEKRRPVVRAMHTPEHLEPPRCPGRKLDDALGLWPGLGQRGSKRKASFIKIIQRDLAVGFWVLQRFEFPLGLGKGVRVAEAVARFSHPLPSTTGLFGPAFQRRQPEALGGGVGEALPAPLERLGFFWELGPGEVPVFRAEGARSAATRFSMHTLGAMLFPVLEPGRYGDTMALIGRGDGLDRHALGTQAQTMGATPGSPGGVVLHRGC